MVQASQDSWSVTSNNIWKQNKNLPQLAPVYLELINTTASGHFIGNYSEENIYPSNYSYYEYRYLKKKTVPKKEINNNIQITSKYGKDNHNKNSSNVSLILETNSS